MPVFISARLFDSTENILLNANLIEAMYPEDCPIPKTKIILSNGHEYVVAARAETLLYEMSHIIPSIKVQAKMPIPIEVRRI